MNKQNTRTQRGITLVALIITIVVLLILAVVTIGAVRNSNIIAHAQNAATKYEEAKNNELSLLSKYETQLEKYASSKEGTTGVKAYNFNGSITIFTPENELYLYVNATDFFPSYKINLVEVNIENDPTYNITISSNDFTQEEISKMHLVTATEMNGICAYFDGENGRDTFYWNTITAGSTEVTITKSSPIQHSEQLLAQYYHETTTEQYYFGKGEGNTGTVWIINDVEGDLFSRVYSAVGGVVENVINTAAEIVQNETAFNIKLDGEDYTIRTDAKIVTYVEARGQQFYIQDDMILFGSLAGGMSPGIEITREDGTMPIIKLFNSSLGTE